MIKYDIPMDFEVFAWYSNIFQWIPYGVSKWPIWCFMFWTKPFAPTVPPIDDGPLFPETRHWLRGEILHDAQHVLTERHSLAYDRSIRCAWKRVEICRNGSYVSSMWVLCEFYVTSMWGWVHKENPDVASQEICGSIVNSHRFDLSTRKCHASWIC